MKKFFNKLTCALLIIISSVTLIACDPPSNNDDSEKPDFLNSYVDNVNKEVISDSSEYFINNGVSGYHILLASDVDENRRGTQEKTASEINFFLTDAGYSKLPVVYDNEISTSVDFSKKYISIGNTTYYKTYVTQNNLTNDLDFFVLGNDGYKIRTKQNVVLINAYGNNGARKL